MISGHRSVGRCLLSLPQFASRWIPIYGHVQAQCFHFMKKQVTVDPEIAKLREGRKRRKLTKAIKKLAEYSKKPIPVEEIEVDLRHQATKGQRERTDNGVQGRDEKKEAYGRKKLLKQYAQSRARLARTDIMWIKRSIDAQENALEVLKQLSPTLYEAAVQLDERLFYTQIQGPPISPPIDNYNCPDGEYQDVTKKWELPMLEELEKKFGTGRLIKMPEFKKKQIQMMRQKAEEEEEKMAIKDPWLKKGTSCAVEEQNETEVQLAKA
ncbi:hypothetical protein niasHS_013106 [Heterodera schachtii]|uniref:Large ribosomal subunit protein mL40 n=1 Tax=Heterodera schachtii TaxID=97005 RepID=A0ABD2IGK1_HETSC